MSEGYFTDPEVPCPRCGAILRVNTEGQVWCSFIGGRDEKACNFGLDGNTKTAGPIISIRDRHARALRGPEGLGPDVVVLLAEIDRLTAALADERRVTAEEIAAACQSQADAYRRTFGLTNTFWEGAARIARSIGSKPRADAGAEGGLS